MGLSERRALVMKPRDRPTGSPELGSLAKENTVRTAPCEAFGVVAFARKSARTIHALWFDKQNAFSCQRFDLHEMACNIRSAAMVRCLRGNAGTGCLTAS
jgi:hypothetical protein